jgi:hypothetical protein
MVRHVFAQPSAEEVSARHSQVVDNLIDMKLD